ncbi:MAG: GntR family transcriptional regulator [Micrococcales bacterium]|nr:GntR family transcriptional regulator [Micrococcales bacterium]
MDARPNRIEAKPVNRKIAPRRVLADHVYDQLMASLVDGELTAGSSLNIDALANEMEVSQSPIREALARLEGTGLVRRTALKGYWVAPMLTTEELVELMDARLVLEPVNAFLACQTANQELLANLDQSITDFQNAPTGRTFSEFRSYWQADEHFHMLIAAAANNRFLLSAYTALGGHLQRFRLFAGLGVTDAEHATKEHALVRDAFRAGDAVQAREAMQAHINGVKARAVKESQALG